MRNRIVFINFEIATEIIFLSIIIFYFILDSLYSAESRLSLYRGLKTVICVISCNELLLSPKDLVSVMSVCFHYFRCQKGFYSTLQIVKNSSSHIGIVLPQFNIIFVEEKMQTSTGCCYGNLFTRISFYS